MADNIEHQDKGEQVANCDRFNSLKHSTVRSYAFTEQGVAMLSTVLRSETAIVPNFYRSPQHLFHLSLTDGRSGKKIDAIVDTGASGTILTNRYYKKNENCFAGRTATDSLRTAGVGGEWYNHQKIDYEDIDNCKSTNSNRRTLEISYKRLYFN